MAKAGEEGGERKESCDDTITQGPSVFPPSSRGHRFRNYLTHASHDQFQFAKKA